MASFLSGLDFYLNKPKEVLILKKKNQSAEKFLVQVFSRFLPNKFVTIIDEEENTTLLSANLFLNKDLYEGKVTVFVCQNFTCSLPVITEKELDQLLD
jgi:uncharacterized protein YyaL (SSP411 family)